MVDFLLTIVERLIIEVLLKSLVFPITIFLRMYYYFISV